MCLREVSTLLEILGVVRVEREGSDYKRPVSTLLEILAQYEQ